MSIRDKISETVKTMVPKLRQKFLRTKLQDGWMAVAFSGETLLVAHVRRRPGEKPEVLMLRSESRGPGDQAALRTLARSYGLAQCRCNSLLNPGEYQLLQVELPAVPPEEMKEAVRWKIKDLVDFQVETMTLDLLEIPGIAGRAARVRQGMAVATADTTVAERMALFDGAGAMLEAIDIPEAAIRNISALYEEQDRGLAMLVFDDERATLTFTFRGELYAVRQIDISASKLELAEGDWRQQLFDRIGLETQRSLDNFERLHGHITVTRLLLSPLPMVAGLMEYLADYLSLPVGELDLAEVLDIGLIPDLAQPGRQAQCLKVIGAALRD